MLSGWPRAHAPAHTREACAALFRMTPRVAWAVVRGSIRGARQVGRTWLTSRASRYRMSLHAAGAQGNRLFARSGISARLFNLGPIGDTGLSHAAPHKSTFVLLVCLSGRHRRSRPVLPIRHLLSSCGGAARTGTGSKCRDELAATGTGICGMDTSLSTLGTLEQQRNAILVHPRHDVLRS